MQRVNRIFRLPQKEGKFQMETKELNCHLLQEVHRPEQMHQDADGKSKDQV
jgi:hypothetical protein